MQPRERFRQLFEAEHGPSGAATEAVKAPDSWAQLIGDLEQLSIRIGTYADGAVALAEAVPSDRDVDPAFVYVAAEVLTSLERAIDDLCSRGAQLRHQEQQRADDEIGGAA